LAGRADPMRALKNCSRKHSPVPERGGAITALAVLKVAARSALGQGFCREVPSHRILEDNDLPAQSGIAVVTASASGIGREIARSLGRDGYRVVISDIDREGGAALARELDAEFRTCDMRQPAEIEALFDGLGPIDVLVNNAGIAGPTRPLPEISREQWQEVIDVNLTAAFLTCRIAVPGMIAARKGSIVNLSSVAGKIGYPNRSPYCASKWAVLGLTASLAREVGRHGVRVNAILPGTVRGPRIADVIAKYAQANGIGNAEAERHYLARQATEAYVEPAEVAEMVSYLCSPHARSITGQFIGVDGGFE
jgi:NAD(P)-dependent dehydrogenase (short-subunit alcohol dehydrogenase family)